ncbi:hypothetical protein F5Y18DRAFT_279916 [Xylariaceae sp. FL1019]|nr:hypothetical protein F5Y18DRAFT_279916 [Xylariaceae sp. FL1019]
MNMAGSSHQSAPPSSAQNRSVTVHEHNKGPASSMTTRTTIDAQPLEDFSVTIATESDAGRLEKDDANRGLVPKNTAAASLVLADVTSPHESVSLVLNDGSSIARQIERTDALQDVTKSTSSSLYRGWDRVHIDCLPNEVLLHILGFLDVSDLLAASRISHHFRALSVAPILHTYRLQRVRLLLPPLLTSPSRPTLAELIARHIFLTKTTQISRRLARSLVSIRLSRCLPQRPSAETLVQRGVLPPECVPGCGCAPIAPALVAKRRAVEKEKLKDGLRRWVGGVWKGEVRERSEGVRKWEERAGVGRVWRLRRFWERVGRESG